MRFALLSLLMGVLVGVAYGLANVRSPAPPIVALLGLLGMVIGESAVLHVKDRWTATTPERTNIVAHDGRSDGSPPR